MSASYSQFCPVAKASEIFATRWTPLIVRELMTGARTFNDIHRGVPLISRAVLVARLRELQAYGVVERRPRLKGDGLDYVLTPAGEDLRAVIAALGQWGMSHTQDRIKRSDLDPALLIWGLRRRVDVNALPDRRIVLRFEFSGVPASRTKFRIMWLILGRSSVDVCMKDPGFAVDVTLRGNIRDCVNVYLGHVRWKDAVGSAIQLDGDRLIAKALPVWLRFEPPSASSERVHRKRAEHNRRDHGKCAVESEQVKAPAISSHQRTRIKVQAGLRRQFAHGGSPMPHPLK
jgi:DNA-binding HxlR family transcriptional regulator